LPRKQGIVMMTVLKKALVAMRKMTNRYQWKNPYRMKYDLSMSM
jgi:hypothetical protein